MFIAELRDEEGTVLDEEIVGNEAGCVAFCLQQNLQLIDRENDVPPKSFAPMPVNMSSYGAKEWDCHHLRWRVVASPKGFVVQRLVFATFTTVAKIAPEIAFRWEAIARKYAADHNFREIAVEHFLAKMPVEALEWTKFYQSGRWWLLYKMDFWTDWDEAKRHIGARSPLPY